jgi:hypothetical protein
MSLAVCTTCPPLDCCEFEPFAYDITGGIVIGNAQVSVVFDCPPGFTCTPGTYPKIITIPKDKIRLKILPDPPGGGGTLPLRLQCCQSEIVRYPAPGMSETALLALAQGMVDECARQLAACTNDDFLQKSLTNRVANDEQFVSCPDGTTLTNVAFTPPQGVSIVGNALVVAAGVFTQRLTGAPSDAVVAAAKAAVNAKALDFVRRTFTTALSLGRLECATGPATAPCSLFTADTTLFGTRNLPVNPGSVSWTALPLGNYQWVYVGHIYQRSANTCPLGCEATYGMVGPDLDWSTSLGALGTFPSTSLLNEACCGGGLTGFSSKLEATVATDYATKTMPSFVNLGANGTTISAQILTTGSPEPATSPSPVLDLRRVLRLTVAQPDTLTVAGLATFAASRFTATYEGQTTAPLALNASSAVVQAALNALLAITTDGGVTCAGTLTSGVTVTWLVNGARPAISLAFATVSPGYAIRAVETTPGTGGTPEVQTLTVEPACTLTDPNVISPQWTGSTLLRDLNTAQWHYSATFAAPATLQVMGFDFANLVVKLVAGPTVPLTAPVAAVLGAGTVDPGIHRWKVTFVSLAGESGGSPESNALVLAGASEVRLTSVPTGPAGTTSRNIYRTLAGGTRYYLAGNVPGNVTTQFDDNTDDTTLFNGGFVTALRPASCFWACCIETWQAGSGFNGTLWCGTKSDGTTPEGTYLYSQSDFAGSGSFCPLGRTDTLPSLALIGTF